MSFAQFHDGFYRNVKVRRAGSAAAWMWAASIGYASEHMTDGFVPVEVLNELSDLDSKPRAKLAARLVEVGLWEPCDGGWRIHDYLKWNLSRVAIVARREANLARVNKHRTNAVSHSDGNARVMHYNAHTSAVSNHPPSVPLNLSTNPESNTLSPAAVAPLALAAQATVDPAPTKPAKTPRAKKPAADPPPFSVADALDALASTAGRRFVVGDKATWAGGWVIALQKLARQFPDLSDWRLVGAWLAAGFGGGLPTAAFGVRWAASGALPDAVAKARAWDADGRPAAFDERGFPVRATVEAPDPWAAAMRKAGVQ